MVTFSSGQTAQQIQIDLLNDAVWEGQETLALHLNGFNGTVPGLITNFTLRINDSRPVPTASFGNFSTSFQEVITSPSMPVQLSGPIAILVKVNVAVTGGTATGGGVDFSLNSGTVYFEAGETTKNVNLTCVNDVLNEPFETIGLTLSPGTFVFPSDGYTGIGVAGITSRTFEIADDDTPPTANIQQFYFLLSEGQSTNAIIRLTKPSGFTVSLNLEQLLGNASPADLVISPTSLTFLPGETQKVVTVTVFDDTLVEGDEGFALTMTSANGVLLGSARAFYIRDLDGTRVTPEDATAEGFNPGHRVRFRKAADPTVITTINVAENLLAVKLPDAAVAFEVNDDGMSVINYDDFSGITGLFPGDRQIATPPLAASKGSFSDGAEDNFAMRASGFIQVTNPGVWSFVVNSDDGFQLRLGTNQQVVSAFVDPRAPAATTNRVNLPMAGYYPFELIFFEFGGGALVEFFAFGPGQPTPKLVGDASGVLRVYQTGTSELRLTITKSGNRTILRWPGAATGFTLERCPAFAGASTVWTPVSGSPALVGQFWQQTDSISGTGARFYRLRR